MSEYDSRPDTAAHIAIVRDNLAKMRKELIVRGLRHDDSKLRTPEVESFDRVGPQLPAYDDPNYGASLAALGEGLIHHYRENDHHPEHYVDGDLEFRGGFPYHVDLEYGAAIGRMSLLALTEMLADWEAAVRRHPGNSMEASLKRNRDRFGIEPQLYGVLVATCKEMGWVSPDFSG